MVSPRYYLFKKRRGLIQGRVPFFVFGGVALCVFIFHNSVLELAANDDVGYAQRLSRFAFAQHGFRTYLADKAARKRQAYISRVLMHTDSGEVRESTWEREPGRIVRLDDRMAVKLINHRSPSRTKTPALPFDQNVRQIEQQAPSGALTITRLDQAGEIGRQNGRDADGPTSVDVLPAAKAGARATDTARRTRLRVIRRTLAHKRAGRSKATRKRSPSGSTLISDLPAWARAALFQSGG